MPIFEFICKKCNKKFEKLVLSGEDKPECPECKNTDVEKQFSSFSSSCASSCSKYDSCRPQNKHKCSGGCCHGH